MQDMLISTNSKQYPVFIGEQIRFDTAAFTKQVLGDNVSAILIITDDVVAKHYLDDLKNCLRDHNHVFSYTLDHGEQAKSFQQYYDIQTYALEKGLDRRSLIIALGGGVVGDIAGFVAATYMRGIPFIQVPTTLLAHDSSVGGKVAINHPLGKNMIGAFHQPEAVIYDYSVFSTLPESQWRSGFAEVIKHALIWDPQFYDWLREEVDTFADISGETAERLLMRSMAVKAAVVQEDERESGIRAFLNFGHTLGHAIETELGYGKITHGEAVVIGMAFALKLSERLFRCSLGSEDLSAWFRRYGYDTEIPQSLSAEQLLRTMRKDKKVQNGIIRMVLLKKIGQAELVEVDEEQIHSLLVEDLGEV
ncbi:3-dehydroquinate synthase [Desertibacillus haloalkaliphilus]|uniref:3-dehydroquinate synthase n=1 Tax=Desertibacillus haloalkaliphilus TaxID=1328930 RepID=UPI001C25A063|nr:3-dehydroquinate synthase [Desertibacillus haloalkaliphilus]MBU8907247.1 3-dehydroquinate synthase [Desertibacillus haloalkaliphilus]